LTAPNALYRTECDPLGEMQVPADKLYGLQTLRALENFRISPLRIHPALITAFAEIKKAEAETNIQTGELESELGFAIGLAASEVIFGQWRGQFDLDVFQAGAGTSYNINTNEVLANRALETGKSIDEILQEDQQKHSQHSTLHKEE
jgi:aspartate ammonia-lyase